MEHPPAFRVHLQRAIDIAGSQAKLAIRTKEIGSEIKQQHISYLMREGHKISAEQAMAVDTATNGAVSKHDLRPDIFGPRAETASNSAGETEEALNG